jgi:hypothetical protein
VLVHGGPFRIRARRLQDAADFAGRPGRRGAAGGGRVGSAAAKRGGGQTIQRIFIADPKEICMTDRHRPMRLAAAAALTALAAFGAQAIEATQWRPWEAGAAQDAGQAPRETAPPTDALESPSRTADFTAAERGMAIAVDTDDPIPHIAAVADDAPVDDDRSPAQPPTWRPADAVADEAR